ncbi:YadA C-terminal domain-containing protein [uncultured Sneathia sp.]|uniref:YadA C-terminal domain-containing protein n=1 Tax=uncultured Sneathia sp. TaxID=278067 RepID=UPI002595E768|nr:YadA C-terminal domain-containing protein [uncultured Sneathia sp.]
MTKKIDALSKTANHALDGVSLAVAMANLPTVSSEYNHNISVSYGTYAGSHSFALGLSGHIANDRLNYKLSGAINTKGNLAFGVGVGVNLGKKNQTNKELLDRIEKLENLVKQLQNK